MSSLGSRRTADYFDKVWKILDDPHDSKCAKVFEYVLSLPVFIFSLSVKSHPQKSKTSSYLFLARTIFISPYWLGSDEI